MQFSCQTKRARLTSSYLVITRLPPRLPIGISSNLQIAMAKLNALLLPLVLFIVTVMVQTSLATVQPKAPNFQYFERPKYRYPYYDEHGRGKLLYGYGGPELYQYKTYTPLEGIH
ncbi:uncharacterized protein LOC6495065 [Drosophila ananassae]|nr:uncharacterized protein LOC6495065 [Drosophila ananassae]